MNRPKLSVVVPVYNVSKFIERCARSLFEQTLDDIEYIFVDDCSPDDSIDILRRVMLDYPERKDNIHIIRHSINKGLPAARNSGLSTARGEYLANCDSDDYVATDMYESLYCRAKEEGADLVFCDFNFVYPNKMVRYFAVRPTADHTAFMKSFIASSWTVACNYIVSNNLVSSHNLSSPEGISLGEDFHLVIRLAHFANCISIVEKPLYFYNQENTNSITNTVNRSTAVSERRVYLEAISFFREQGVLKQYERELSWRVLKNKQDLVLNPATFDEFLSIYPECHKYILSCPLRFCNRKIKMLMWMLTHGMKFFVKHFDNLGLALGR